MKKALLVSLCFGLVVFLCQEAKGQTATNFSIPKGGEVSVDQIDEDLKPLIVRLEMPSPIPGSEKEMVANRKTYLAERSYVGGSEFDARVRAADPWIGESFRGNTYINGVPNDNDLGVSNSGLILSAINSNLFMLNDTGAVLADVSLDAWSTSLGLGGSKFDPRVVYDPVNDRFIVVCLNGFSSNNSKIVVGFSQTNDPTGGWNLYAIPGAPLPDSTWTDYPIIAITNTELFITGNLIFDNQPWQTGFDQSIVWQISSLDGYSGDSLNSMLWTGIGYGGKSIRNLCLIQDEASDRGPAMAMLSNRNFDLQNDSVFVMQITDSIGGNPQFLTEVCLTDQPYGMPPNGIQPFNHDLATNDARWLDAMMINGVVQFVGNSIDTLSGRSTVYHGRITGLGGNLVCQGTLIGDTAFDYGYPAIAWAGVDPGSTDAMIAINYTGRQNGQQPGCGAMFYDGSTNTYSNFVMSKSGDNVINVLNGTDRWGDYTGLQRRYSQNGIVWMAGTFGRINRQPGTWISSFHHPAINVGMEESEALSSKVYPNPAYELVQFEFEVESSSYGRIVLYNAHGQLVRLIVEDMFRAGLNQLSLDVQDLQSGVYFLKLTMDGVEVTEQIMVH